ncbi:MAG TPA: SEC-C metal-binding domain-containing protein [Polyangia bacterium]
MSIWRRIECTRAQTLHHLHQAIQSAFKLDNDHLYAFFLNNRPWDHVFDYGGPGVTRTRRYATDAVLAELPLKINKRILYIFDFGDDLRYDVKVDGEGLADHALSYPRVIDGEGEAPPQYQSLDEDDREHQEEAGEDTKRRSSLDGEDGGDSGKAHPGLQALVPVVERCLRAHFRRRHPEWSEEAVDDACPWAGSRQAVTLQAEREAALAIVERSGGNLSLIQTNIEDALESTVWRWLGDLPRDLSDEGHHADAVTLSERLAAVWRDEQLIYDLPLLLARVGDRHRALSLVESNLAEFPDEASMLLPAGQALETLGENDRAESAYRDALTWVGFETSLRDEIVTTHIALLDREGRANAAERLRQSEGRARREVQEDRSRAMGLLGPPTIRRTKPKIGRNESCPCGSGKKYKKCCGRGQ